MAFRCPSVRHSHPLNSTSLLGETRRRRKGAPRTSNYCYLPLLFLAVQIQNALLVRYSAVLRSARVDSFRHPVQLPPNGAYSRRIGQQSQKWDRGFYYTVHATEFPSCKGDLLDSILGGRCPGLNKATQLLAMPTMPYSSEGETFAILPSRSCPSSCAVL